MDPSPKLLDALFFPTAAYHPDLPLPENRQQKEGLIDWSRSFLNPATRIETLDSVPTPTWDIDGAEPDGIQFWALPRFTRGHPPQRIDVYVGPTDIEAHPSLRPLANATVVMVGKDACARLDIARHILRALEYWSSRIVDFERLYMSMPFGSQICIKDIKPSILEMEITFVADYALERQWLSATQLKEMWQLPADSWPSELDLNEIEFIRQMHDSISLVTISKRHGAAQYIFKAASTDVKLLYLELRNLLELFPHPNILSRPIYVVTKKVRFGGKQGLCGVILEYLPLGTLGRFLACHKAPAHPMTDRLKWARQATEALIHIHSQCGKFYADLNMSNIGVKHSKDGGSPDLVIIDFDQRTGLYNWSPPEVYYVDYIERLARGHIDSAVPEEYRAIMRSLFPNWTPPSRHTRYHEAFAGYSIGWLALSKHERDAAMVYMAGKLLWCIFENVEEITEPAIYAAFRINPSLTFPEFKATPPEMRDCIRRCTAGAPEWEGRRQPFVIRQGRLYPRAKISSAEGQFKLFKEVQSAARWWWKEEIEDARRFLRAREKDQDSLEDIGQRPKLEEVLGMILSVTERAQLGPHS
ncbi:hypothetical protein BDW59DRAFT_156161 [Aspergillus cavernicola]|uniref:Protein kinase domain-containing protein n=1 Tax=Aspergillus cavernicola TaxID=176166 RepID=A0ABR4J2F4_9EURO